MNRGWGVGCSIKSLHGGHKHYARLVTRVGRLGAHAETRCGLIFGVDKFKIVRKVTCKKCRQ